jgi:hypothetical protein
MLEVFASFFNELETKNETMLKVSASFFNDLVGARGWFFLTILKPKMNYAWNDTH